MDAYEFAQKYRHLKARIEWREITGKRVQVVFLKRCPKCGYTLPGMLRFDGFEACTKCEYERLPYKFFI